jgi:osmoprotectant transport system substrate-binding protein
VKPRIVGFGTAIGAAIAFMLQSCSLRDPAVIRIGSKFDTEGAILGYTMLLALEEAGFAVEDRIEMGPTLVVRKALTTGEVDGYIEYTGTALVNFFKLSDRALLTDAQRGWAEARKQDAGRGLTWLAPWALNNTYTVLMAGEKTRAERLATISGLAKAGKKLVFGSDPEFAARADGLPGLLKAYGITAEIRQMNAGLIYQALRDKQLDAGIGYSTDGRIPAFDLVRLADDRSYFPAYHPAPIFRTATLTRHPGISTALDRLAPLMTDDAVASLNYEMDVNRARAKDLARGFLKRQGLLARLQGEQVARLQPTVNRNSLVHR